VTCLCTIQTSFFDLCIECRNKEWHAYEAERKTEPKGKTYQRSGPEVLQADGSYLRDQVWK
jgi:hypothetical protein